jgi:hypothetical protein
MDRKFTSESEWAYVNVTSFHSNRYNLYLQTKQDRNFVYLKFDGIKFKLDPKRKNLLVRYQIIIYSDGNNENGTRKHR